MRGYSLDLRERIVRAVAQGKGKTAVSKRFEVSLSTVKRYLKRHEQGELAARKGGGRKRRLASEGCEQLRKQVEAHQDWSLEQHARALTKETGVEIKKSSVGNYLKRLGITHKKRALLPANEMKANGRHIVPR
jgi:transposase